MTKQQPASDSGSFLSGLGIGLIGGAVTYFLFATEKGEKVKVRLVEEWQAIRTLTQEASGQPAQLTTSTKESILSFFSTLLSRATGKSEATTDQKRKPKRKKMFKGID
ncbi:MAG: hypothetical protein COY81_04845 [Candidatus Pacebacteria bacterium CG_4_10_14_0_8_um_filter_43_12]|nr:MAG: hypothetical protein COU66_03605 [Candidatus Pacebacteria bacterium CG10_big_fil_rev_8_21_14_0_10_44_11]PIY79015.1 MAG: hypothetical protein COY81_04845 [Candidatus Pacebacteria bacterium CG_4_10_14_0_8_um_filter_43_12]